MELAMTLLKAAIGVALVFWTLLDAFEQVIMPRSESHVFRISSLALRATWGPWKALARRMKSPDRRAGFLAYYGPLSVLILLATWDLALILGFSLGFWSVREGSFINRFYTSGSNFFTLGLSRPPVTDVARVVTLVEAGVGLAFLAVIIGYLPVYYSALLQSRGFHHSLSGHGRRFLDGVRLRAAHHSAWRQGSNVASAGGGTRLGGARAREPSFQ